MEDDVDDGGPAFPSMFHTYCGMTLRDYFAAQALQGALLSYAGADKLLTWDLFAETSYLMADAMLRARKVPA